MKKILFLFAAATLFLSSCLKEDFGPSNNGTGQAYNDQGQINDPGLEGKKGNVRLHATTLVSPVEYTNQYGAEEKGLQITQDGLGGRAYGPPAITVTIPGYGNVRAIYRNLAAFTPIYDGQIVKLQYHSDPVAYDFNPDNLTPSNRQYLTADEANSDAAIYWEISL